MFHNALHLARKYAQIFFGGHYLLRKGNRFRIAKLEANCKLWGTDNVQGQICETSIFSPQMEATVLIILQLFFTKRTSFWKLGNVTRIFPSFWWGWYPVTWRIKTNGALKYLMDYNIMYLACYLLNRFKPPCEGNELSVTICRIFQDNTGQKN